MSIEFGRSLRPRFLLAEDYTSLNHGSFGAVPRPVHQRQAAFLLEQEERPDLWFRETYYKYIDESRGDVAKLVNAPSLDDIVLIENASSAVNSLLRSLTWKRGDKIIRFSNAYHMVVATINWLRDTYGVEDVVVDLTYPIVSSSQVVEAFRNKMTSTAFESGGDLGAYRVAIFSHVVSVPTIVEPVEELTRVCKEISSDCLVLIDAAHSLGAVPIDIEKFGCDFYLGNCHKWMFCPKGAAFLYVKRSLQCLNYPQPTVISSSGKTDFIGRYAYTGTRDYTAFSSIPYGIKFYYEYLGGFDKVHGYNHSLLVRVVNYLCDKWGTFALVNTDLCGVMANVVLPISSQKMGDFIHTQLYKNHNLFFCPVQAIERSKVSIPDSTFNKIGLEITEDQQTIYYTRFSFQVYNSFEEYERFSEIFLKVRAEYVSTDNAL